MIYFDRATVSDDTLPKVLWDNLFDNGTITASTESSEGLSSNIINEGTNTYWQPTALPAWVASTSASPYTTSSFAIVGHNLYTTSARVKLEYLGSSRTNLILQSQTFDNASWGTIRSSVTPNTATAPDGTLTADSMIEDTSVSLTHTINQTYAGFTSGVVYVFSVCAKTDVNSRNVNIGFPSAAFTTQVHTTFDLTSGTVASTTAGATNTITYLGDGWYRCSVMATATTTASGTPFIRMANGTSTSYTGDGTTLIHLWGAQLETGTLTSYIPTTTVAASSTYYDATNWIVPTDNTMILVEHGCVASSTEWRLRVSGVSSTMPYIGVFILGNPLTFPGGVMPPYTPIWQAQKVDLLVAKTLGGQFMGNRILRQGAETSISLVSFSKTFGEVDLQPFKEWYNAGHAFVWASGPSEFDKDVGYVWRKANAEMRPTFTETGSWIKVTMEVEGYVQ